MKVLIADNQIAGIAPDDQDPTTLPNGFTIAEYGGEVPIEALYFDNGDLKLIPTKPDGDYQWNGLEWVEIPPIVFTPPSPIGPDWDGLLSDLRGSEVWAKSFVAASTSIAANSAWTLLCSTLMGTNKHVPDLIFAIGALRAAMAATDDGDYTKTQVTAINKIMIDRGFPKI